MRNFSTNASEFNKNILTNTILVKISIPLFCLFITFVVFIGGLTSLRVRSNQISTCLYFVCVIVGSFCMMMASRPHSQRLSDQFDIHVHRYL